MHIFYFLSLKKYPNIFFHNPWIFSIYYAKINIKIYKIQGVRYIYLSSSFTKMLIILIFRPEKEVLMHY